MPIHFTCPHCGVETDVDDQYGGQTIPCIGCKQTITFPESQPGSASVSEPASPKWAWKVGCLFVAVVLGCGGIIALLLPAVEGAREAARRAQCMNNLKQIGLAIHNYHEKYHRFPPAYLADETGKPMHSWRALILPFMERGDLYSQYHFDEPWDGPHNSLLANQMPSEYHCPSDPGPEITRYTITSYAMIVGPHAFSDGPTGRRTVDIKDRLSTTIMVAEAAGAGINWLEPRDLDAATMTFRIRHPGKGDDKEANDISSCHPIAANVLFCDGSAHSISDTIDPAILEALLSVEGSKEIKSGDF